MSTYGNRQLSLIFFPVVETHANGFFLKKKCYGWGEVERIEVWEKAWRLFSTVPVYPVPNARFTLREGRPS